VILLLGLVNKQTGKGGVDLKVENPGQYHWEPKTMLRTLLETLLHFATAVSFLLCTVTFHANNAHNLTRSP
jgi:hypothetical protein